jgi:alpha-N-arabinofuranosidase
MNRQGDAPHRQRDRTRRLRLVQFAHANLRILGATVLEQCYETVDFVSLHSYYEELDGDPLSFLASAVDMDNFIDAVIATSDAVGAKIKSRKRLNLSFDEWNVWYASRFSNDRAQAKDPPWLPHPRIIEDDYTSPSCRRRHLAELTASARRPSHGRLPGSADQRHRTAALRASGDAWKQTIAYPFEQMRRLARGQILQVIAHADRYDSASYTDVPLVDASATYDDETVERACSSLIGA